MASISAVIITFNEEKNIERCIQSLRSVVDEIIVSDSHSTDNTVSICQQLGANVIIHNFIGYGATKNNANQHASHPWILSIDADEALDEHLISELQELKAHLNDNTVYQVQRLNNYCGKWIQHGGWYPDRKVRLFNKQHIKWNLVEVHETLEIPKHFTTTLLKGKLQHYSYASIESHLAKIEKYSTRGAEELFRRNKKATLLKRLLSPAFRFIRDYFFKLGILDGYYGYVIAKLTAYEVYLKYHKLHQLNQPK